MRQQASWLWAMWKWRKGIVPSFEYRRALIQAVDKPDIAGTVKVALDWWAGPAFYQRLTDLSRRRKMAVWKCCLEMEPLEQVLLSLAAVERLLERLMRRSNAC